MTSPERTVKITCTSTMTVPATGALAGELTAWASNVPPAARITATTETGDRGGSGHTRYTATWEEANGKWNTATQEEEK